MLVSLHTGFHVRLMIRLLNNHRQIVIVDMHCMHA